MHEPFAAARVATTTVQATRGGYEPAPTFAGQPFDVGGTPVHVPHWSLHVRLHEPYPRGMFTPFNPNLICP